MFFEVEMKKLVSILDSEKVVEHLEPQESYSVFCSLKQWIISSDPWNMVNITYLFLYSILQ